MIFSVIIPAYQCQSTIKNAVESICSSGLEDYEIIIVDDGSSDKTPEICCSLAAKCKNIRYIKQENRGASIARNRGIECAAGQYVLFFDADDSIEQGSMTEVTKIVTEHEPDLLIFGLFFDYYQNGKRYKRESMVYPKQGLLSEEQWGTDLKDLYSCNALTPVWNKVYKRSLIGRQVKFDSNYFVLEDFLFVLDFLKNCKNIYCLPKPIYCYRQPENEGHAYDRMKKITNLNAFMTPFESSMRDLKMQNKYIKGDDWILNAVYYMLLEQKLYKADIKTVKSLITEYKHSSYCETLDNEDFNKYTRIHRYMIRENYIGVWCWYRYIRLRHKIAVQIKPMLHRN